MLVLLLLFVGVMEGAALSPPAATITIESAKYCLDLYRNKY